MGKFLQKLLIYGTPVLIATGAVILLLSETYWNSKSAVVKSKLRPPQHDTITVVLGSSHTQDGINSRLISEKCFNYASSSQSYFEDYHVLKSVLSKTKVGSVLLPLSYFSNHSSLEGIAIDGEHLRIYDYEHAYGIRYPRTLRYHLDKRLLPPEILKTGMERRNIAPSFDERGNLAENCDGKTHDLHDSVIAFQRHDIGRNFKKRHPYMDSVISLCQREGIVLYIIVMPFSKGYRNQVEKSGTGFKDFKDSLRSQSAGRFVLLDFQDFIKEKENLYFKDTDHLSVCGRDFFSKHLGTSLPRLH